MPTSVTEIQDASEIKNNARKNKPAETRAPSIIVGTVAAVVAALSVFYLLRPEPLLVQSRAGYR